MDGVCAENHSKWTYLRITQMDLGPKPALLTNLVQLAELAPQHLGLKVGRISRRRSFRRFEGFTEVTQEPLDVVSLDDERAQFEAATAVGAFLDVDLKRAFEKLSPGAISRAMGWRMIAVGMPRVWL